MINRKFRKLLFAATAIVFASAFALSAAKASTLMFDKTPDLPEACSQLTAPEGAKLAFHVYATGDQIYRWNGTAWVLFAPDAKLYATADFEGLVGKHFIGPTWESNSGSSVVAAKLKDCTPDVTAVPWLSLKAVVADGPGIFSRVTFIQRLNTTGGLKPTTQGTTTGEEYRSHYTAEYYFYRGGEVE
jgi:hypothetical protein